MSKQDMLRDAVNAKTTPVFMSSKADVIDYYRDTYKGQRTDKKGNVTYEWKTKLVNDLIGVAKNKKGEDLSRANISRRFQAGRESTNATAKGKGEYETIGKKLPPTGRTLKGDEITINIRGTQTDKRQHTRPRDISITLSGNAAKAFVMNPTFDALWDAFGVDLEDITSDGYEFVISSVS